jgi:hypothetical protein
MKFTGLPLKPTRRALRQFAAAWLVFFLALAARQFFARLPAGTMSPTATTSVSHHPAAGCVFGAMALIGVAGLWRPQAVKWLFIGATIASFPIGWVVTQLMLAIMFYLVLTPVALIFRWRGRDELQLRRKPGQSSFWISRGDPPKVEKYLKQF